MKNNSTISRIPAWLTAIVALNAAGLVFLAVWMLSAKEKHAYVDLGTVYNGFDMTKEKTKQLESTNLLFANRLDSLSLEIRYLESQPGAEALLQQKRGAYTQMEAQMSQSLEQMRAEGENQVWTQINLYTSEYGKQQGYDYIFGGNGSGSLMYAKDARNISEEVLAFINKKYAGE